MLQSVEALQKQANVMSATAQSIGAEADLVVAKLKGFQEWAAKAVVSAGEVHEAVKAKLDEDHATLVTKLGEMAGALDDIIQRLEGGANG